MSKTIELKFDYFANSDERPLLWATDDGSFLASAGIEPYYSDKYTRMLYKNKQQHSIQDLLSFAHENNAKVTVRVITPKDAHEIAFPFITFSEIYTDPKKAIDAFKNSIERRIEQEGYKNVKVETKYNNPQTNFGKAYEVKKKKLIHA